MKTQEILLASAVIALVSGVGAALATRALESAPLRVDAEPQRSTALDAPRVVSLDTGSALDELRMENVALRDRVAALEARLGEESDARTPLAAEPHSSDVVMRAAQAVGADASGSEVTPEFVESVGRAIAEIDARKEAEREAKRKELQAQRIEERVAKLQVELGLNNRQSSDLRTALIAQDDKREALFATLRDGEGDPRDLRDRFRTIRDETYTTLEGVLSGEQMEGFRRTEENEFRRGFGDFGGGGPPRGGTDDARRPGR